MQTPAARSEDARGIGFTQGEPWEYVFTRIVLTRGLSLETRLDWRTSADELRLPQFSTVLSEYRYSRRHVAVIEQAGVVATVDLLYSRIHVRAAARHHAKQAMDELIEELKAAHPEAPLTRDDRVRIGFWSTGRYGPRSTTKRIECPDWDDIDRNYAAATRSGLEGLAAMSAPPTGGKLLLWHGLPGTGKTWAIQALAKAWRSWCSTEYVVDPEAFLGDASYLTDLLLDLQGPMSGAEYSLLVLEDVGELLTADAKSRVGQSLSRFLNLVDGFIGRGIPFLTLVTANEELDALHPAVVRPGRCAQVLYFDALSAQEAAQWAGDDGGSAPGRRTLAELYGAGETGHARRRPRSIGFEPR